MTRDKFRREFLKYQPGFVKAAEDMLHDREAARDVVMDTAEKLLKRLAQYDAEVASFRTWFTASVKNASLVYLRSARREAGRVDRSQHTGAGRWITRQVDDDLVAKGHIALDVKNALARFAPDERALLEEVLSEGVEVDTRLTSSFGRVAQGVAKQYGTTADALMTRLVPLIRVLRARLGHYDSRLDASQAIGSTTSA